MAAPDPTHQPLTPVSRPPATPVDPADGPERSQSRAWRLVLGSGIARGGGGLDGGTAGGREPEEWLEPLDGAGNMAVDQALLESVREGGTPVLRLYRWAPPTLSFGRNQPARDLYDRDAARDAGIDFVRRPTGGQAVLHADELTYAVVAPVAVIGKPRAAYRRINVALVAGLRGLGLAAAVARSPVSPPGVDWTAACFRTPAAGEVVVGGRKLVGSAQRMEARVILQHGSILIGGSQAAAESLLVERTRSGTMASDPADPAARWDVAAAGGAAVQAAGWTTVEAELGIRPGLERLIGAVVAGFEATLGISLARHTLTLNEADAAARLRGRYASDAWTWRR